MIQSDDGVPIRISSGQTVTCSIYGPPARVRSLAALLSRATERECTLYCSTGESGCEGAVYRLLQTILTTDDCLLLPFRLILFYLPFCLLLRLLLRSLLSYRDLLVLRKLVSARLLLSIQCNKGLVKSPR